MMKYCRKYLCCLLPVFLLVSCTKPSEDFIDLQIPSLTLEYGESSKEIDYSGVTWYDGKHGVAVDSAHAIEINYTEKDTVYLHSGDQLTYHFDEEPNQVSVFCYLAEQQRQFHEQQDLFWNRFSESDFLIETPDSETLIISEDFDGTIYEICAKWDEGTVIYPFQIKKEE